MYGDQKIFRPNKVAYMKQNNIPLIRFHSRTMYQGLLGFGYIIESNRLLQTSNLSSSHPLGFLSHRPISYWRLTHNYKFRIPRDQIILRDNVDFSDTFIIIQRYHDGPFATMVLSSCTANYVVLMGIDDFLLCLMSGDVTRFTLKGKFHYVSYQQVYYLRRA